MFRGKLLIGCVFIVSGIVWPTVSIQRALSKYSDVCRTAVTERREVQPTQRQEVMYAVEQGGASILGGFVMGLFGIGLALEAKRDNQNSPWASSENMEA